MRFATSINPAFEKRSLQLWDSVRVNKIPMLVYLVDYPNCPQCIHGIPAQHVKYSEVKHPITNLVTLQNGAFTQFWKGSEDETVIFVDADSRFQRPLAEEEKAGDELPENILLVGRNKPSGQQTLAEEAQDIQPTVSREELDRVWPGYDRMLCRNFGFVAGRISTWRKLYEAFAKVWPEAQRCFRNRASCQFANLYAAYTSGIEIFDVPLHIHAHGHFGPPPEVKRVGNTWQFQNEPVLFAHHL